MNRILQHFMQLTGALNASTTAASYRLAGERRRGFLEAVSIIWGDAEAMELLANADKLMQAATDRPTFGGAFLDWRATEADAAARPIRPSAELLAELSQLPGRGTLPGAAIPDTSGGQGVG